MDMTVCIYELVVVIQLNQEVLTIVDAVGIRISWNEVECEVKCRIGVWGRWRALIRAVRGRYSQ